MSAAAKPRQVRISWRGSPSTPAAGSTATRRASEGQTPAGSSVKVSLTPPTPCQDRSGGHGHVGGLSGAVSAHPPGAKVVLDRFHAVKLFNDRLSELRLASYREATDVMHE